MYVINYFIKNLVKVKIIIGGRREREGSLIASDSSGDLGTVSFQSLQYHGIFSIFHCTQIFLGNFRFYTTSEDSFLNRFSASHNLNTN